MAMLKDDMDLEPREQFDLLFYDIGQGDCCLIRCPDNKIVVVDCGCKKEFEVRQDALRGVVRSKDWTGGNANKVNALILTHPAQQRQIFELEAEPGRSSA